MTDGPILAATRPAAPILLPGAALDREDVRARVQKVLEEFVARQAGVLEEISEDLPVLTDALSDMLGGGKRLRAAFCYWGWRGAGAPDVEAVVAAAAALELFHAAALIHDDVMDDSDTRRGMQSTHRRFASLHRSNGWVGDPEHYGVASAILLGDLCLSWCDELISTSGLGAEALGRGRRVFDVMRTQLMGGQYLDILEQVRSERDAASALERARDVIRFKSAKYTIEHPLLLGGSLGGGSPELLAAYSAYGLPLGEAFQLRDDVLGVFGDPEETGKPAGDDLREGKRTVLVAAALERATPAQAHAVQRHLGDPHLDLAGIETLRAVVVDTGALARVESMISDLTARALRVCETAPVGEDARSVLCDLVVAATARRD